MSLLKELKISGNPIEKLPKYRDQVLMMAPSVEEFNGKTVIAHEREFLFKFYKLKYDKEAGNLPPKKKPSKDQIGLTGKHLEEITENPNKQYLNNPKDFSMATVVHQNTKRGPSGAASKKKLT